MAKYCGAIGYAETEETSPGVFVEQIKERVYFGDVIQFTRRLEAGSGLNDDVKINNRISIIADAYAQEHIYAMRYAVWNNCKWKVTDAEYAMPRIVFTLGGLYNG